MVLENAVNPSLGAPLGIHASKFSRTISPQRQTYFSASISSARRRLPDRSEWLRDGFELGFDGFLVGAQEAGFGFGALV